MIKTGWPVSLCRGCGKHFYETCLTRVGQCPICGNAYVPGEDLPSDEDLGITEVPAGKEPVTGPPPGKLPGGGGGKGKKADEERYRELVEESLREGKGRLSKESVATLRAVRRLYGISEETHTAILASLVLKA